MSVVRKIKKVYKARPVIEGAGVHLKRVFGYHNIPELDPFLMLDDFRIDEPELYEKGFPWHPHRGIETITYILKGDVEHGDSLGNKGNIGSGDVQWMTAGSGIIHQEMPKGDVDGKMYGFQLWANLPATDKMMNPRYREIKSTDIPELTVEKGVNIKIIAGKISDVKGPMEDIVIEPEFLDVSIPENTSFKHELPSDHTFFAYIIDGTGNFDNSMEKYGNTELILFEEKGDYIEMTAGEEGMRLILVSGKPLKEPVAWRGPIVMNTEEELDIAFEEYENNNFIKFEGK